MSSAPAPLPPRSSHAETDSHCVPGVRRHSLCRATSAEVDRPGASDECETPCDITAISFDGPPIPIAQFIFPSRGENAIEGQHESGTPEKIDGSSRRWLRDYIDILTLAYAPGEAVVRRLCASLEAQTGGRAPRSADPVHSTSADVGRPSVHVGIDVVISCRQTQPRLVGRARRHVSPDRQAVPMGPRNTFSTDSYISWGGIRAQTPGCGCALASSEPVAVL
ncbi:hypothetical protein B0H14DRAFT_2609939 [Mycena olivaceomarginata]|nr:hypothetical protein B0H14DRAFT_2609939 [Mycena olivaceomarginata]